MLRKAPERGGKRTHWCMFDDIPELLLLKYSQMKGTDIWDLLQNSAAGRYGHLDEQSSKENLEVFWEFEPTLIHTHENHQFREFIQMLHIGQN